MSTPPTDTPWVPIWPINPATLPERLGEDSEQITDWNNVKSNGWYFSAPDTPNAPFTGDWAQGEVIAQSLSWVTQRAWRFADATSPTYQRRWLNGSWSPWVTPSSGYAARRIQIDLNTPRGTPFAGGAFWNVSQMIDYDFGHWEFRADSEGQVNGVVSIPPVIAPTPNGKIVLALAANTATASVTRMAVGAFQMAPDGSSINQGHSFGTYQDIALPAQAWGLKTATFPLSPWFTPYATCYVNVCVYHNGTHANDTCPVNTCLYGAWLEIDC